MQTAEEGARVLIAGPKSKAVTIQEAVRAMFEKYGFGDGGSSLTAAPIAPQAPQAPQALKAPRAHRARQGAGGQIKCVDLERVAYNVVRLMTPAEATGQPSSTASTGAARTTGPIRRKRARAPKFSPIRSADPQMQYGRYPKIPRNLKQNLASATSKSLSRIPFGVLESAYIGSNEDASIAARDEGAKREQLLCWILGAIAETNGAQFSSHDAYFAKDPAVLGQTLRGFIQAAFKPDDATRVCSAFTDVLRCINGPVAQSALWCHSPRTMLDIPLRSLCGITTMIPHFNFARKSWDQPSPLVGPIKARLAVL